MIRFFAYSQVSLYYVAHAKIISQNTPEAFSLPGYSVSLYSVFVFHQFQVKLAFATTTDYTPKAIRELIRLFREG